MRLLSHASGQHAREQFVHLGASCNLSAAPAIRDAGINVVVFQGAEVPQTTSLLSEVLPKIRELFEDRVEVLLGSGVKSEAEYRRLKERGADTYILKHETATPFFTATFAGRPSTSEQELSAHYCGWPTA